MNGINPYDPVISFREQQASRPTEHLADYNQGGQEEFDGFNAMEEEFVLSAWPDIKHDIEDASQLKQGSWTVAKGHSVMTPTPGLPLRPYPR